MPGEFVALIARQALDEGPTCTSWPGLMFYRIEQNASRPIGMRLVLSHCV